MLFDKNNKKITNNGKIYFPDKGFSLPILYGEDDDLWIYMKGHLLPLRMWDTTKLEFIENPF